jgi:purine-binding chemotaxis protein CheW
MALVEFRLGTSRYALELHVTERVLPMVAITRLPGTPDVVLGTINVHGAIVPVVDLGRRLGYVRSWEDPDGRLLLARLRRITVALPVDEVIGAIQVERAAIRPIEDVAPGVKRIAGVVADPDGLLLVHEPEELLSLDEQGEVEDAFATQRP